MKLSSAGFSPQPHEGEKKVLNSELWHACAGPLVSLPAIGNRVVYFAQGHSEQVTASTNKEVDKHIPNYPSLPPQLICQLHNVTMHADVETDEVYAQMTLQPLSQQEQKETYLPAELVAPSKQPTNYFCKTLTASDTSTHGGFSVPRRAAEKVFPPLDFSQQPPAQELMARDLHDNEWKFRHIFRGQPKRHLLTTGWSVFVSAKRLVAGDSVIFIWNEKNQLLLGIRRANRPQTIMPSSVLSCDSMHLGLLAAAAHAAATNSRFTIFYNPRASPTEFVIPFAKYVKAVYNTRVSVGMRFRMMFETEESSVRRYMGTITGISDSDPRWANSHWRSVKVGWDESTAGERQPRVSLWEIEPLTTFPMYPPPFSLRLKRPWPAGLPSFNGIKENDLGMNSTHLWLGGDNESLNFNGGVSPWMQPRFDSSMFSLQSDVYQSMAASAALEKMKMINPSKLPAQFQYSPQGHTAFLPNTAENVPQQAFLPTMVENRLDSQPQIQTRPQIFQQKFQIPNERLGTDSYHCLLSSFPPNEDDSSRLLNLQRNNGPIPSSTWPSKRAALDPLFPFLLPQVEEEHLVSLPPFPGRECSINQQNHLLYGLNIEPKGSPYCSNFMASNCSDYPDNEVITPSTSIDDPGFLSAKNMSQEVNPSSRNFVKVYKSGSFGRSLDISKFNSYHALRSELAQMFSLDSVLEDPLRSGWQLVFVDRENEILLLGDDPWPEFVNHVWCIKILSPQEVLEMGRDGAKLLNAVSIQRPSAGSCDENVIGQNSRNVSSGVITSGGSIHN